MLMFWICFNGLKGSLAFKPKGKKISRFQACWDLGLCHLPPRFEDQRARGKKLKTFECLSDGAIYDSKAVDERKSCQRGELIIIYIFSCYAAVFSKYGATLLMFNCSDLVPR